MNRLILGCSSFVLIIQIALPWTTNIPRARESAKALDSLGNSSLAAEDVGSRVKPLFGAALAASAKPPFAAPYPSRLARQVTADLACPEPSVVASPLPAGQSKITVSSPCRPEQEFSVNYAGIEFVRKLDAAGKTEFVLDCLAAEGEQALFRFDNAKPLPKPVPCLELDQVTRVAVVWQGRVNLDLHAFEYAAEFGQPGHVWAGAPSSAALARAQMSRDRRSHGFMSMLSDGRGKGGQVEAYTLLHAPAQTSGLISTALDFESRARSQPDPETCGTGIFSEISYEIIVRDRRGAVSRSRGAFAPLQCGAQLPNASRYNSKSSPRIAIGKP
jgi:hypothetical protein